MQILFTDRALPTVRRMDQIGRVGRVSPKRLKITVAYAFISLSRFHPSLTGLAVPCVTESADRATAKMTMSLQVDLVLSDAAATNEP